LFRSLRPALFAEQQIDLPDDAGQDGMERKRCDRSRDDYL